MHDTTRRLIVAEGTRPTTHRLPSLTKHAIQLRRALILGCEQFDDAIVGAVMHEGQSVIDAMPVLHCVYDYNRLIEIVVAIGGGDVTATHVWVEAAEHVSNEIVTLCSSTIAGPYVWEEVSNQVAAAMLDKSELKKLEGRWWQPAIVPPPLQRISERLDARRFFC